MNYTEIYKRIIGRARSRVLAENVYIEKHHIIPKCLGGSDDDWNIVPLTAQEHFVAHQLLVKIYPTHKGLLFGAFMLSNKGEIRTGREYRWIKELFNRSRMVDYIQKECELCGDVFEVVPSRQKTAKYCSKRCFWNAKTKNYTQKSCVVCGGVFEVVPSKNQLCCSWDCGKILKAKKQRQKVRLYDHKYKKYISFNSQKQAAESINAANGDVSSLLAGKLKYVKMGRYTVNHKDSTPRLFDIKIWDTYDNKWLVFSSRQEMADSLDLTLNVVRNIISGRSFKETKFKRYQTHP